MDKIIKHYDCDKHYDILYQIKTSNLSLHEEKKHK